MVNELTRLYLDTIKKHAANPVGFGVAIDPTHQHEEYNPLCGDRIRVQLRIDSGQIEAAAFDGEACAICMASASLLCDCIPGQTVDQLKILNRKLREALEGKIELPETETLSPLLGVKSFPSRIRCATLPWTAATLAK
ncbi:Fe-S cluster assembly sulfur transfer protein SufU [Pseudomonadota bacterium]